MVIADVRIAKTEFDSSPLLASAPLASITRDAGDATK